LKPYTQEESENIDKVINALVENNIVLREKLEKKTEKPTEAKGLPKEFDHSNEIFSFVHCRKCVEENEPYPMIECGWTKFGFMVMCRNHNQEITFFPLPPEMIPVGCNCEKCQENEK